MPIDACASCSFSSATAHAVRERQQPNTDAAHKNKPASAPALRPDPARLLDIKA